MRFDLDLRACVSLSALRLSCWLAGRWWQLMVKILSPAWRCL